MDFIFWIVIVFIFSLAYFLVVFPIFPSFILVYLSFFFYGWTFGFDVFSEAFWWVQFWLMILMLFSDVFFTIFGVHRFGGSVSGKRGSAIGVLFGQFLIPIFGLFLGALLGAFIGEGILNENSGQTAKDGIGILLGYALAIIPKLFFQTIMIIVFFSTVLL